MDLYSWIIVAGSALFGLAVGSFIGGRVMRTVKGKKQNLLGRSECFSCHKPLGARDLVPLFSYLFLRGKCRRCGAAYSSTYFLVELVTAVLFAAFMGVMLWTGALPLPVLPADTLTFFVQSALGLVTLSVLIYVSAMDLILMAFPVRAVSALGVFLLVFTAFLSPVLAVDRLLGALVLAGTIALIRLLGSLLKGREAMGEGDIWVAALVGISLGLERSVVAFYAAFLLGALVALLYLLPKRKKGTQPVLPFAPFLAAGWFIATLWGLPLFKLLFPVF